MAHENEGKILLYVEDELIIQFAMMTAFEDEGFELLIANDGAEALNILATEKRSIAAVVTDINLGNGPTGWIVARSARERLASMPVVYASSASDAEWRANGVPFSKLIAKPFRPSHIVGAVSALLAAGVAWAEQQATRFTSMAAAMPPAFALSPASASQAKAIVQARVPEKRVTGENWIVGPMGERFFRKDLPLPASRWTSRRKAEVVAAFRGGLISGDEVQALFGMSVEELAGWQRSVERFGLVGLMQSRMQHYRELQWRAQQFGWTA